MSQDLIEGKINYLWPTPVKKINLLNEKIVSPALQKKLHDYADRADLVSNNALARDPKNIYSRYNYEPFSRSKEDFIVEIKDILLRQVQLYVDEVHSDSLLKEFKIESFIWFVLQHSNDSDDVVTPHFHEGSDVAFSYYIATPDNQTGKINFIDPRGSIGRGGFVFPRHVPFLPHNPQPGEMLIFPRYAMHYTTLNTSSMVRKSIAGSVRYDRVDL